MATFADDVEIEDEDAEEVDEFAIVQDEAGWHVEIEGERRSPIVADRQLLQHWMTFALKTGEITSPYVYDTLDRRDWRQQGPRMES